ncbi:MAG: hypothetical protein A2579_00625 [Lysobacterales bacterium RIFOXYD1_FULL_69_11]|nr:MAG: hypothetical protein A2190_00610 [Xanthomonadales bacterium RIFOXYA1_FULL_69_10]OHE86387.1 MAG: hypothetical protein A2579_00625 [Xanthomonadales bacterium RIFOXYD1_FULL_69_11]
MHQAVQATLVLITRGVLVTAIQELRMRMIVQVGVPTVGGVLRRIRLRRVIERVYAAEGGKRRIYHHAKNQQRQHCCAHQD